MNRDRALKALALLVVGAALGAGVAWSIAENEAAKRAYTARCLFRVAERHIGHDRLIVEWRAEIKAERP